MPRRTQKDMAAEIKGLLDSGKTHAWIMANRSDLANGWNEVAKGVVAQRPPRPPGPIERHRNVTADLP